MLKYNFDKVACNFNEIALRHEYSPVNFLHIFRTISEHIWKAASEFKEI